MNKLFDNLLEFCMFYFSGTGQKNPLYSQKKFYQISKRKNSGLFNFKSPKRLPENRTLIFGCFLVENLI